MGTALSLWRAGAEGQWLQGADAAVFRSEVASRLEQLGGVAGPGGPGCRGALRVLNLEPDDTRFLAGLFAALASERPVHLFLGSARWSEGEKRRAFAKARPDLVWDGAAPGRLAGAGAGADESAWPDASEPMIWVPSGGSTGGLRFAGHTRGTLGAAAAAVQAWLGGGAVNSLCFLPLHHVSGLMQIVRAIATGGRVVLTDWGSVEAGRFSGAPVEDAVTSLVPTQLARLLDTSAGPGWLRRFRAVFLGGAAAWTDLLDRARAAQLPLAPTYGMTETAAQVAALRPGEFLAGKSGAGLALPHARIEIVDGAGKPLPAGREGRIRVRATSLYCGYWPAARRPADAFDTGDRGVLSADGMLTVLGRFDALINTGGEKVDPAEVESAVRRTRLAGDVAVVGVPDTEWGEIVAAVVTEVPEAGLEKLKEQVRAMLAPHMVPKRWVRAAAIPRSGAGKVDRAAVRALVGPFGEESG